MDIPPYCRCTSPAVVSVASMIATFACISLIETSARGCLYRADPKP
jgi:hypothetical protein